MGGGSPVRSCELKRHKAPVDGPGDPELTCFILFCKEAFNLRIVPKKRAHIMPVQLDGIFILF